MDKELTPIKCPCCNSTEFEEWHGHTRCSYCGTVFKERIKPLLVIQPNELRQQWKDPDGIVFYDSSFRQYIYINNEA